MGLTQSQRRAALARFADQGMVDRTRTLWTDPQTGMRVVRLETAGDYWLEGCLMGNCLKLSDFRRPDRWPAPVVQAVAYGGIRIMADYCSLRDADGHPRATFHLRPMFDDPARAEDETPTPWEIRAKADGKVAHELLDLIGRAAAELGWHAVPQAEYEYVKRGQAAA